MTAFSSILKAFNAAPKSIFILALSLALITSHPQLFAQEQEIESIRQVDILFLFDDTVSFLPQIDRVSSIMTELMKELEAERPETEFAFGVARFEDYGGPGYTYCSGPRTCEEDRAFRITGRPFILNQPMVTTAAAGGTAARDSLIIEALQREAPGFGGDDPESTVADALFQAATGLGFDGDGDGILTGSNSSQIAGALDTQINPDESGDIPPFSSLSTAVPSAGTVGGVGFREESLKLIILATDICTSVAFPASSSIPERIQGEFSSELVSDFRCSVAGIGEDRFGFIGDSTDRNFNTVPDAVAPLGSASIEETIAALNANHIRVIGMGPQVAPLPSGSGPAFTPAPFLSALARITGAVDAAGTPLVFDVEGEVSELREKILDSIRVAVAAPENPGCTDVSFAEVLGQFSDNLAVQRKLVARGIRLLKRRTDLPRKQMSKLRQQANASYQETRSVLENFPRETTICANSACLAISQRAEIDSIIQGNRFLNRQVRQNARIYSRTTSTGPLDKLMRMRKRAKRIFRENKGFIEQLPQQINDCRQ